MEFEVTVIIGNSNVATFKTDLDPNDSENWGELTEKEKKKAITAVFLSQCEITYKVIK